MEKIDKALYFVFIGRSGSGKGTQAELLMEKFKDLYYISTGDLFRGLIKRDTETAYRIKKVLEEGGLPFDDLATMLWMHEISFNVKRGQGVILDGAPRRKVEAENLDRFLDFLEKQDSAKFILIDISREEAFNRLTKRRICKKCGKLIPYLDPYKNWEKCEECGGELMIRFDDNPEAIKNRLDYFDETVLETIDYYKEKNKLIVINGEQGIEKIHNDIMEAINLS